MWPTRSRSAVSSQQSARLCSGRSGLALYISLFSLYCRPVGWSEGALWHCIGKISAERTELSKLQTLCMALIERDTSIEVPTITQRTFLVWIKQFLCGNFLIKPRIKFVYFKWGFPTANSPYLARGVRLFLNCGLEIEIRTLLAKIQMTLWPKIF